MKHFIISVLAVASRCHVSSGQLKGNMIRNNKKHGSNTIEDLNHAFTRYAGPDQRMNRNEWRVFADHSGLLSCGTDPVPGVEMILKEGGDNYASNNGNYSLFYGERWNGHVVYVSEEKNRLLMFRFGSWLVTGLQYWPGFKRIRDEGERDGGGGGFQSSQVGVTDSMLDSVWKNYDIRPIESLPYCEATFEEERATEIWNSTVVRKKEESLSFDHFLVALGEVALDRKVRGQDRNTVSEVYEWISQEHAREEQSFCHVVEEPTSTTTSNMSIVGAGVSLLLIVAVVVNGLKPRKSSSCFDSHRCFLPSSTKEESHGD